MKIKSKLKYIFPNIYYARLVKKIEKRFLSIDDPVKYTKDIYFKKYGVQLDLDNPKTFYEKVCYLKLFGSVSNPEKYVDKVLVKYYLTELGYEHLFAKKIASYKKYSDFKKAFKGLKQNNNSFVIKLSHTSGDVFFYENNSWRDKHGTPVPKKFVFACLKHMIRLNYYHYNLEKVYNKVVPQILIEEYLPSLNNSGLDEYKFFINNGDIKMINVVFGRQKGEKVREAFTDSDLKVFPVHQNQKMLNQEDIYKPTCFNEMVTFCKSVKTDSKIIRVDLMTDGTKFKFCEFTIYDCAGINIFYPIEENITIGNLFDIKN